MTDNPNLAVQERFVTAVFAGDADTIRALTDPQFELHEGSTLVETWTFRERKVLQIRAHYFNSSLQP